MVVFADGVPYKARNGSVWNGGRDRHAPRGFEPVVVSASDSVAPEPRYAVSLLGGFRCNGPESSIDLSSGTQRIVAFLALFGAPQERRFVAGSLWPEMLESSACAALRKQLWRLGASHPDLIVAERTTLRFGPDVTIDYEVERARLTRFLRTPADEVPVAELDRLVQGNGIARDLLPGWYEDWVLADQERWLQLRVHTLEKASELFRIKRRWSAAIDAALAAMAADPFRESGIRLLVEAHVAEGNLLAAARSYETFEARTSRELGMSPTLEFRQWLQDTLAARREVNL